MGASDIYTSRRAVDMSTAFNQLVDNAEYESGHDPYNGTISTCDGFRDMSKWFNELLGKRRKTQKFLKECKEKFEEKAIEECDKRECYGIEFPSKQSTKKSKLYYFVGWAAE